MKRHTPSHTKTRNLAMALGIELWGAVGILESLWHWTAEECPRGDIGKVSNQSIATHLGWLGKHGTADQLVEALVATGWLDVCHQHRLLVHHWTHHCEDAVHMKLCRQKLVFACGMAPKPHRISGDERKVIESWLATHPEKSEHNHAACAQSVRTESSCAQSVRTTACALPLPLPLPVSVSVSEPGRKTAAVTETANGNGSRGDDVFVEPTRAKTPTSISHAKQPTSETYADFFARLWAVHEQESIDQQLLSLLTVKYHVPDTDSVRLVRTRGRSSWSAFLVARVVVAATAHPKPNSLMAYCLAVEQTPESVLVEASTWLKAAEAWANREFERKAFTPHVQYKWSEKQSAEGARK